MLCCKVSPQFHNIIDRGNDIANRYVCVRFASLRDTKRDLRHVFVPCYHELACIIHTTQKQSTLESRGNYLDSEELVFGAEELDGVKIEVDVQCFAS